MPEVFAQFTFANLPCRIVSVGDEFVFEEKRTDAMGEVSWRPGNFPHVFQPLCWPEKWAAVSETHYIHMLGISDGRNLDTRTKTYKDFPAQSRGVVVTYLSKNNHAPDDMWVDVFAEVDTVFGRLLVPLAADSPKAQQVLLGAATVLFAAG